MVVLTAQVSWVGVRLCGTNGPMLCTPAPVCTNPTITDPAVKPLPVRMVVPPTTTGLGSGSRVGASSNGAAIGAPRPGPCDAPAGGGVCLSIRAGRSLRRTEAASTGVAVGVGDGLDRVTSPPAVAV